MDELYRKLLAQLEEGQDTVLAFITEGDGSIPRTTGAYMLSAGKDGFSELSAAETWNIRRFCMRRSWCRRRKVNTENTISEPEREKASVWSAAAE